jgi:hypothetical protein
MLFPTVTANDGHDHRYLAATAISGRTHGSWRTALHAGYIQTPKHNNSCLDTRAQPRRYPALIERCDNANEAHAADPPRKRSTVTPIIPDGRPTPTSRTIAGGSAPDTLLDRAAWSSSAP